MKNILAIFFTISFLNIVNAQGTCGSKWNRAEAREKNYPKSEWIIGLGQYPKSAAKDNDEARQKAYEAALKQISTSISYTSSNNVSETEVSEVVSDYNSSEISESVYSVITSETSASSFDGKIVDMDPPEFCDGKDKCWCFVCVRRAVVAKYYCNLIEDEIRSVKKKLKEIRKQYKAGNSSNVEKITQEVNASVEAIKYFKDVVMLVYHDADVKGYDVTKYEDELKGIPSEVARKQVESIDGIAALASIFVPGAGQWYKGRKYDDKKIKGDGVGFFLGELIFVGGGVTSYYYSKQELAKMQEPSVSLTAFNKAKKNYKICRVANITAYSLAAALYVGNVFHAGFKKSKKDKYDLCVYPSLISVDDDMATGLGLTINF